MPTIQDDYYTVGMKADERNRYDEEPSFVQMARDIKEHVKKHK